MVEENFDDADGFRGFAGKTRSVLPAVEDNPISGVRLGVTYPEITAVQVQAIIEAACAVARQGIKVHPEIIRWWGPRQNWRTRQKWRSRPLRRSCKKPASA